MKPCVLHWNITGHWAHFLDPTMSSNAYGERGRGERERGRERGRGRDGRGREGRG